MSPPLASGQVRQRLEARREQAVEWLLALVGTHSVAPNEENAQRIVADIARSEGLTATTHGCDATLCQDPRFIETGLPYDGRSNLVVEVPGAVGQPLVLNAHIDTVVAGEGWMHNPAGELLDGRVYGLGAADTKASMVAGLLAAAVLAELDQPPAFVLHSVIDEEPSGNGTLALLRSLGGDAPRPWLVVVGEPTGLDLCPGHRGMLWYQVDCIGRQAHGATGGGINAIELAADVVTALRSVNQAWAAEDPGPYGVPNSNIGIIRGGEEVYTTPGKCQLDISVRYAPGDGPRVRQAAERAMASAADGVRIELVGEVDAAETPQNDPALLALREALEQQHPSFKLDYLSGGCDMRHYRNLLGVPAVVFGPGDLGMAHAADEYVEIDQIVTAAAVLVQLASLNPEESI